MQIISEYEKRGNQDCINRKGLEIDIDKFREIFSYMLVILTYTE